MQTVLFSCRRSRSTSGTHPVAIWFLTLLGLGGLPALSPALLADTLVYTTLNTGHAGPFQAGIRLAKHPH